MTNRPKVLFYIGILLLLIGTYIGFDMWRLLQAEILWGHRAMYLFLCFWMGFVLIRNKKDNTNLGYLFQSTLTGVLLAAGFPPSPFTTVLFVAFVPLLQVIQGIRREQQPKAARQILWYAYHSFVVWNILTTFWVANTSFAPSLIAIWLNSFFMAFTIYLYYKSSNALPKINYGIFVSFWMAFEYLHLSWDIRWPWLTLGNALSMFPEWVQWYEYTGVLGGTLWILIVNTFVIKLLQTPSAKRLDYVKLVALILLPIVISLTRYYSYEEQGDSIEVVVVQPNYEPHYEKFRIPEAQQVENFIRLSEEMVTPNTDYVLFPETSFGLINIDRFDNYPTIRKLKRFVNQYPNLHLITGISGSNIFEKGEPHSPFTRTYVKPGGRDTVYWETMNAAIQLSKTQDTIPLYIKTKLVPGAEFIPYRDLFFFVEPIIQSVGGSYSGNVVPDEPIVLHSPKATVAAPICYESIYGEFCTKLVKKGASALFIMTNDGWWDKTAGHKQHLQYASLRAIETRRSIARSANTGISAFINQRGDILQPTKYDEPIAIRDNINLNNVITFYTIWGNLLGRLSVLTTILIGVNAFARGWLKRVQ